VLLQLLRVTAKYFNVPLTHEIVVEFESLFQVGLGVHFDKCLARRSTLGIGGQVDGRLGIGLARCRVLFHFAATFRITYDLDTFIK
jgi:hypothetical protein